MWTMWTKQLKFCFKIVYNNIGGIDAFEYFELFNKTNGKIVGLKRIDTKDYTPYSLRASLLNAVIHRLLECSYNLCYEKLLF